LIGCPGESLGLVTATLVQPGTYDVAGYAVASSPTLGAALERLVRYTRLLYDEVEVALREEGDEVRLVYRLPGTEESPLWQVPEAALALLHFSVKQLLGGSAGPVRATFSHSAPVDLEARRRFFQVPLLYDQEENALVFARSLLERSLPGANPGLCVVLDRYAEELLARLPREDDFLSRVRQAVAEALHGGEAHLDEVALRLDVAPRTLQRRLQEAGTSHQALVDEVRRTIAERHLGEGTTSIAELAFLLGFSEPSAFHRAFRRWTGLTPAEYRRRAASAG
ncbi:MAG: AraC family transcriptional regulator ligand-binding domain-containing protein, partial [Myxococcaceae bacterium]